MRRILQVNAKAAPDRDDAYDAAPNRRLTDAIDLASTSFGFLEPHRPRVAK